MLERFILLQVYARCVLVDVLGSLLWLTRCSCTCWCACLVTLFGSLLLHLLMWLSRYSSFLGWSRNTHGVYEDSSQQFRAISQHSWCLWRFVSAQFRVISQHSWCLWRFVSLVLMSLVWALLISQHSWCLWRSPVHLDLILTIPAPSPLNWK